MDKPVGELVSTKKGTKKRWPLEDWAGSRDLAGLLAGQINDYWAAKGRTAGAHVVLDTIAGGKVVYRICSDMVNGMPAQ